MLQATEFTATVPVQLHFRARAGTPDIAKQLWPFYLGTPEIQGVLCVLYPCGSYGSTGMTGQAYLLGDEPCFHCVRQTASRHSFDALRRHLMMICTTSPRLVRGCRSDFRIYVCRDAGLQKCGVPISDILCAIIILVRNPSH